MATARLYYNPSCSKSRAALALLRERGIAVDVVDYLATPPSLAELQHLAALLRLPASAMLRTDEDAAASITMDEDAVLALLAREPERLQRPILVAGGRALIARPPERVLELLAIPT